MYCVSSRCLPREHGQASTQGSGICLRYLWYLLNSGPNSASGVPLKYNRMFLWEISDEKNSYTTLDPPVQRAHTTTSRSARATSAMAPDWLQPRNGHIVAVIALLASSVGGFVTSPQQFPSRQLQQPQGNLSSIRPKHKKQQGQQQQQQQQQCGATQRRLTTSTSLASALSSLYGHPISSSGDQEGSGINPGSQRSGLSQLRRSWAMSASTQEQRRKSFLYGFGWRWDGPSYLSLYSPKSSKLPPDTGSTAGEGEATAWHTSAEQEEMPVHSGPGNDTSGAAPRKSTGGLGVRVGWGDVRVDRSSPSSSAAAAAAAAVASAGKVKGMGGRGADDGGGGHMKNTTGNVTTTATAAAHANDTMTGLTGGKVRETRLTLHTPHVVQQHEQQ